MQTRQIGKLTVSAIGLGCAPMSEFYGEADPNLGLETIQKAFDLGINFFDTADVYGVGDNEELVGKALAKLPRDKVVLATKFGFQRTREQSIFDATICGTPEYAAQAVDASLKRLNTDYIDLYYLHRIDKNTPIEETIEAMAGFVKAGKIRHIGLSEADPETLRRAHKIHPITALQSEYSLMTRDVETNGVLDTCRELGIGFVPYSPLGRGLLTGKINVDQNDKTDLRNGLPRYQGDNFAKNQMWIAQLQILADKKKCTLSQLCLAWVLAQGNDIAPIPGTKRIKYVEENITATTITFTQEELAEIDAASHAIEVAGSRYPDKMLKKYMTE